MNNLDPEQYRVLHQRIARALTEERGQRLRSESVELRVRYPDHVADWVLRPYLGEASAASAPPFSLRSAIR